MPSSNLSSGNCEIATRAELLQRLAERATPAPELNLTPDRSTSLTVNTQAEAGNESRLVYLKSRLDRAGRELESDHVFSRLGGHARVDFDRER